MEIKLSPVDILGIITNTMYGESNLGMKGQPICRWVGADIICVLKRYGEAEDE